MVVSRSYFYSVPPFHSAKFDKAGALVREEGLGNTFEGLAVHWVNKSNMKVEEKKKGLPEKV